MFSFPTKYFWSKVDFTCLRFWTIPLLFIFGLQFIACQDVEISKNVKLIPYPQEVKFGKGNADLSLGFTIKNNDASLEALSELIDIDYQMLFGQTRQESDFLIDLQLDTSMAKAAYHLSVDESIRIVGGSYQALAFALSTLWQLVGPDQKVPHLYIKDQPQYAYRSIMLDVARAWHHPETIRKIVDLCRWYKINYLHLHLTDDSAFSFPSDAYPQLATEGHAYTKTELMELNQYAYNRGVILVPELDVPGHSSQFIKKMPELFGIAEVDKNAYTINMGKEETYRALDTLIGEVAEVFTYSPFIHIGGDEAFFGGMEDDPTIQSYLASHQLPNMHELFLHFLIRMNEMVKRRGKQTIVWAGFGEKGIQQIPNDVIVMLWNHIYHDPSDLLAKKYPIINASFKPLYVVNNRKWSPQYIYQQWQVNRWEHWAHKGDFMGEELENDAPIMGATLCAWEQAQINQLPRLRHRVASMAQHLWSGITLPWEEFFMNQQIVDEKFEHLILPFAVQLNGLSFPELEEGNFYEHLWFDQVLKVSTKQGHPAINLQYAQVRNPQEKDWQAMPASLAINRTQHLHIRALNADGKKVGHNYHQRFFFKPIKVSTKGKWKELPIGSWEKHRFEDTLWINLDCQQEGIIKYRLDGKKLDEKALVYAQPIPISQTTHFRAQLFDENQQALGSPTTETYFKIWKEKSLTTGRPIKASNDGIIPNGAAPANDGRITLWEMWGDHVAEENWVAVDLEKVQSVGRFKIYTFWDNWRYYQYTIEGSLDGENWMLLVDQSQNTEVATEKGYESRIAPQLLRHLRINLLYNSANPGLHLVEFGAFEK